MTTPVPIHIRPAVETDLGLVVSTWVGSHRSAMRWLTKADHDRLYRPAVKVAIERSTVLVACDVGDEHHVYGFASVDGPRMHLDPLLPLLHYVAFKSKFRELGIARRLLTEAWLQMINPAEVKADPCFLPTAWTPDGQHLEAAGLTSGYRPDLFPHGGTK